MVTTTSILFNLAIANLIPQEWQRGISYQTTCRGQQQFFRIETEEKPRSGRKLICLIQIKSNEVVVYASNVLSPNVQRVVRDIRKVFKQGFIPSRCITLTECPLNCEICDQAKQFYK